MPVTSDFWDNVSEGIIGDISWSNPTNILANDGNRASAGPSTDPNQTKRLRLYNWGSRAFIPSNATITNISVDIENYYTGTASTSPYFQCQTLFNGGSVKAFVVKASEQVDTLSGDLTYWGLTNSEAIDAITATAAGSGYDIRLAFGNNSQTGFLDHAYMEVTWYSPPGGILLAK